MGYGIRETNEFAAVPRLPSLPCVVVHTLRGKKSDREAAQAAGGDSRIKRPLSRRAQADLLRGGISRPCGRKLSGSSARSTHARLTLARALTAHTRECRAREKELREPATSSVEALRIFRLAATHCGAYPCMPGHGKTGARPLMFSSPCFCPGVFFFASRFARARARPFSPQTRDSPERFDAFSNSLGTARFFPHVDEHVVAGTRDGVWDFIL